MMNSVPASQRGAAGGMIATFMNSASVLSIGIFFSLMVAGLSSRLPATLFSGLTAQGVPAAAAAPISHLPPIGVLFAAFLGYNPMQQLLGPLLSHLSAAHAAYLIGRQFFPSLITGPFHDGIGVAVRLRDRGLRGRRRRLGAHRAGQRRRAVPRSPWAPSWPPWRRRARSSPASWSSPTWCRTRQRTADKPGISG